MMRKFILGVVCAVVLCCTASFAAAGGPLKAYVAPFKVTGVAAKEELVGTLQGLLASRLSSDRVQVVDAPQGADILVNGTYIVFGKIFSLDIVVKEAATGAILRSFEQGESQDELIPALGKLAKKITADVDKA